LNDEIQRWEGLLAGFTEERAATPQPASDWSVKDVVAHLAAWQQISIARVEAALLGHDTEFPSWLAGMDPFQAESEPHREEVNARIRAAHRTEPWARVHRTWRQGFLRLLEGASAVPEGDMEDATKYPWLEGYPLAAVLDGSREHHDEHFREIARTADPPG